MTAAARRILLLLAAALAPMASQAADAVHDDHLVPYEVADGAIAQPLTDRPGDAAAGEKAIADRGMGNCLACHAVPIAGASDFGNIGPDLAQVGGRLSAAQIRLRIVNPKLLNPASIMPAFYRVEGLADVAKAENGKPILDAQQVEDVVAYLARLK